MYQIIANRTWNVLCDELGPLKFFNEGQAWDYLEERYTEAGIQLWHVEEV